MADWREYAAHASEAKRSLCSGASPCAGGPTHAIAHRVLGFCSFLEEEIGARGRTRARFKEAMPHYLRIHTTTR